MNAAVEVQASSTYRYVVKSGCVRWKGRRLSIQFVHRSSAEEFARHCAGIVRVVAIRRGKAARQGTGA